MIVVLGIDPGLTGAVAAINVATKTCRIADLPTVALEGKGLVKRRLQGRDLVHVLRDLIPADGAALVLLERVGAMGGKNNAVQTQASLAGTYLSIRCLLDVLRLQPTLVEPRKWKSHYGLGRKRGEKDAAYGARHLEKARQLYPEAPLSLAKHHNRAEALLIAHLGLEML